MVRERRERAFLEAGRGEPQTQAAGFRDFFEEQRGEQFGALEQSPEQRGRGGECGHPFAKRG